MMLNRRIFLQATGAAAGLSILRGAWAKKPLTGLDGFDGPLVQPSYGEVQGYNILSYINPGGWDRTAEFRVSSDCKTVYTSNYRGFSIIDVSNPRKPEVISQVEGPVGLQSQYIDVTSDQQILVVNNERLANATTPGGIRIYDISDPANPVELSFFQTDEPPGRGVHGFWIHEDPATGRTYVFASTSQQGYLGNIIVIVDITDPSNPVEVSRWWYPGQATGEEALRDPTWTGTNQGLPATWVFAHDLTTYLDRAYIGYRDQGVVILDISDIENPTLIGQIEWTGDTPDHQGTSPTSTHQANTHSIGVVVPKHGGYPQYIIATDEIGSCPYGHIHIIDVSVESDPQLVSEFRLPLTEEANCPSDRPGRRFGIHDVDRLIRGDIVHSAWEEGGFWAIDISDPENPQPVAYFVPPVRPGTGAISGHADDVYVCDNGLVFGSSSDANAGGLWIMRLAPGVKGTVTYNADNTDVIVHHARGGKT